MSSRLLFLISFSVALLGGCGGSLFGGGSAPVEERGYPVWGIEPRHEATEARTDGLEAVESPRVVVASTAAPRGTTSSRSAEPTTNSAVLGLMRRAREQLGAGDEASAAASLERALRIEPRNGVIWHNLAVLRLHQRDYAQAESMARKSISFAGDDDALKARGWSLVAAARHAQGDRSGAAAAERRAAELK